MNLGGLRAGPASATQARISTTTMTYTFVASGTHCGSCRMLIDETREGLPGITGAETSVPAGRTIVHANPTQATSARIIAAISEAGCTAILEAQL